MIHHSERFSKDRRRVRPFFEDGLTVREISRRTKLPQRRVEQIIRSIQTAKARGLAARKPLLSLERQEEIRRLAAITEPVADGFMIHPWRARELSQKFGIPQADVEDILKRTGRYAAPEVSA